MAVSKSGTAILSNSISFTFDMGNSMAVNLSVEYKAQFITDLTLKAQDLPRVEKHKVFDDFDVFVKETLEKDYYKDVRVDAQYKRYGMDIGLVSQSKDKLSDACHDIAIYTREQPHLKSIEFDSFE
jgi:hypothetical protein